ncbi:helix-turn-helix domain-containing protein [Kribbella sp. CA-245084]|uniref:helix-turn-helix domain-containing protein n=1 Tax=Kribbella sp. CA-245084 TaxID=3239940 RepID=UPI003D8CB1A7
MRFHRQTYWQTCRVSSDSESSGGNESAFGALLRRHRRSARLTQEELAERSGLSVRAISDLERGRTARPYRTSVPELDRSVGACVGLGRRCPVRVPADSAWRCRPGGDRRTATASRRSAALHRP